MYKPEHYYPQTYAELVDYNGFIGSTFGWELGNDNPEEIRTIKVSDIRAKNWPEVIGRHCTDFIGNQGLIHVNGRRFSFDTTDWKPVNETRPLKKPRAGKKYSDRYDWKWTPDYSCGSGRWVQYWID